MSKILIGLIIGLIIGVSGTALAASVTWKANLKDMGDNTVSRFDDGDTHCYVTKGRVTESRAFAGYSYGISCVK